MRDWFGFKRRRAELKAAIYEQVPKYPTPPASPATIAARLEARTGRMTNVGSLIVLLHELHREGTISRGGPDNHPHYWRRAS